MALDVNTHPSTTLSPKTLQEITEDPAKIAPLARAMGAANLYDLYKRVMTKDAGLASKLEFQRLVNKMGGLEPKEGEGNGLQLPVVHINIANGTASISVDPKPVEPVPLKTIPLTDK